ncbi:hypothetical protein Ddye_029247 [Dipteronia dyeriana]|uniref:Response regulatory domain-containing protein n=1 Tax=Dipteronia dyeriana TaxID=168575 RepID=A0AAD9WLI3_9ROSI|nr:hypothetical protein Ddye_029247 [Dipteronia dyeriana]
MKHLNWNVRGLRNNRTFKALQTHRLDFVFLMETIFDHHWMEGIRVKLGFSGKLVEERRLVEMVCSVLYGWTILRGANQPNYLMSNFRQACDDCTHTDLRFTGPKFTWCNGIGGMDFQTHDDDSTCLNLVSTMLKKWSYEVISTNGPDDALAAVRIRDIDLVVTDLHMPKMNGLELQKKIDKEYKLPVIIMSSDHREPTVMNALASGVVFYMKKPVIPGDFKNIWQYAVASKTAKLTRNIERSIGSIQVENNSTSSFVNKEKHGNNKDSKTKTHKKKREDRKGESSNAPKKAKVVWTDMLHNRFLQAVNYLTLEKAVPKKLHELMNVPELTKENIASHLQKYRLFLKRVAEKGFVAATMNSMTMDRTFRSSFAAGHASLLYKAAQQQQYSLFNGTLGNKQPSYTANSTDQFQSFNPTNNFGSIGGLTSSNPALSSSSWSSPRLGYGQSRLLGSSSSTQVIVHKPIYGSTSTSNPVYQLNRTSFGGLGSNDIGSNLLSRGAVSGTNSMQTIATPSAMDFGTSRNSSHHGTPSNNNEGIGTGDVSFSFPNSNPNYSNNNNIDGGQTRLNSDGAGLGLMNEAIGDSTFGTCLAQDNSSSVGLINHGNYQFPTSFSGANEQGSTSTIPSMEQQQFGLDGNDGLNDFIFELIMNDNNNASTFTDMLTEPTNGQFSCNQQQGGDGATNPNCANSAFPSEMNPETSKPLNGVDFPSLEQMANGGDNLVYMHVEDNWFDARVNIYFKLSHLTIIRDAMARGGMLRRWYQGVFRQFLSLNNELFNGKLCHILLYIKLNYRGVHPEEMWFRVGHRAVRFGKEKFLFVTGLRFRPMLERVTLPKVAPGSIHHQYFGGSPTPLKNILGRLRGEELDEEGRY